MVITAESRSSRKAANPDVLRRAAAAGEEGPRACGSPPGRSSPRAGSSTQKATGSAPSSRPSSSPRRCRSGSSRSPTPTATRRAARRGLARRGGSRRRRPGDRRPDQDRRRAPRPQLPAGRADQARQRLLRRRQHRPADPARWPSGSPTSGAASTRSRSPPRRASRAPAGERIERSPAGRRSGRDRAAERRPQLDEIRDNLSFLQIALLVFAGVALFVGAFLIFNTFSITVAQRVREFGMLRTLGASRGQILASVVAEALLIGLLGSLARARRRVRLSPRGSTRCFEAIGIDLPTTCRCSRPARSSSRC